MSILQNSNAISGAAAAGNYQITNSLRFNSASTQYLTRTLTNSNTSFTFSAWIKRGTQGTQQSIFGVDGSNLVTFETGNTIALYAGSSTARATSTAVFRDPAAWYHIVVVRNGGQGGTTSAWTIYVNNQSILTFTGNGGSFTTAVAHYIGERDGAGNALFDGYMSEINYIDGQALTPSSFGTTDTTSGQWIAKKYTGTYGTNGFYLPFTNGTSTTTLGNDSSGNGNNWTLNNFTRSAGVNDCWMYDVPSGNGSSGTQPNSNYAVLNPLDKSTSTVSNANLNFTCGTTTAVGTPRATMYLSTGKWYWEVVPTTQGAYGLFGIIKEATSYYVGYFGFNGQKYINGVASAYGATYTNNDVIGFALDVDAGTLTCYKNNVSQGAITIGTTGSFAPMVWDGQNNLGTAGFINFGQRSFAYTPPSGFKALCTANLPASTIVKGNQYMDGTLYVGTGATLTITNAGGLSPDLVWTKRRSSISNHTLYDSVRGVSLGLRTNTTDPDIALSGVTSFNSDGFTLGGDSASNAAASNWIAWQWDAGSSTVTNTDGSNSAQVRANPTSGFSIVTYTGTGANATIGHGLGVAPALIIAKARSRIDSWRVYHISIGASNYLTLESTASSANSVAAWNNTTPTSSVFSIGTGSSLNTLNATHVAYCFAEIAGFSKFGSYTGNGSADGPFVYCGFRPKFIMVKRTDTTGGWNIFDAVRNPTNVADLGLFANTTAADTTSAALDFVSNGIKLRGSFADRNASAGTYIYMAFAENPFANANAR